MTDQRFKRALNDLNRRNAPRALFLCLISVLLVSILGSASAQVAPRAVVVPIDYGNDFDAAAGAILTKYVKLVRLKVFIGQDEIQCSDIESITPDSDIAAGFSMSECDPATNVVTANIVDREKLFREVAKGVPKDLKRIHFTVRFIGGGGGGSDSRGTSTVDCTAHIKAIDIDYSSDPPTKIVASPPTYKLRILNPTSKLDVSEVTDVGWDVNSPEPAEFDYEVYLPIKNNKTITKKHARAPGERCASATSPPLPIPPAPSKPKTTPPPPNPVVRTIPPPPITVVETTTSDDTDERSILSRIGNFCFSDDFKDSGAALFGAEYRAVPSSTFEFYGLSIGGYWENHFMEAGGRGVIAAHFASEDIAWYGEVAAELAFSPHLGHNGWFAPFVGFSGALWGETGAMGSTDRGVSGKGISWVAGLHLHGDSATLVLEGGASLVGDGVTMVTIGVGATVGD